MTKGNQYDFLLLYGSQTGQAKAIAEEIFESSSSHGLNPEIHCFSMTDKKFSIENEKCVVIVVSTTGDGEPPDTASKFWRRIKKKTLPSNHLAGLHFTLLGLGDSNYTNFCNNGKSFNKRLVELGATHFYPPGFADDATGLEIVAEPWLEGLYPVLQKHLKIGAEDGYSKKTRDDRDCSEAVNKNEQHAGSTSRAEPAGAEPDRTEPDGAEPDGAEPDGAEPAGAEPAGAEPDGAEPDGAEPDGAEPARAEPAGAEPSHSGVLGKQTLEEESSTDSWQCPSLKLSAPPLSEMSLTIPVLPPSFLDVTFHADVPLTTEDLPYQNDADLPSALSPITMATVVAATRLTREDAVKTSLDLELDISACDMHYEPGDSFSIICPNNPEEVDSLLQRLRLASMADCPMTLAVKPGTKKRRATVPEYIPQPLCTPRHVLLKCCDIRSPIKKAFVRVLADNTTAECERRRLQELCSKQGASEYGRYVRDPHLSLLDVLKAFPSCCPPFDRVLEHLPRLLPRPYSISSSPLVNPQRIHFVFNVVVFPEGQGRSARRLGVCTGWLNDMTTAGQNDDDSLASHMCRLRVDPALPKISIFQRSKQHFHLPKVPSTPIIMISAGTGVAPFMGFLEHRACLQESGMQLGSSWLFFGCRHRDRDLLYRKNLETHLQSGTLGKLTLSCSRDDAATADPDSIDSVIPQSTSRYVQESMMKYAAELCQLVLEQGAVVYVCGDARNLSRSVAETLRNIFVKVNGISAYDATALFASLIDKKQYLEDVWT